MTLSAASDYAVETASFPVLVVPRGRPVEFATSSGASNDPDESAGPTEPAVA